MRMLLAFAAALVFAAPSLGAVGSRVRLASTSPIVVAGVGFRPAERVTVTVAAGETTLRETVAATGEGRFVARWRRSLGSCTAVAIVARGSAGSRAALKITPACAPIQPADQ